MTYQTLAQYNNVNTNTSTFQASLYHSVHFLRYISRSLYKFKNNSPRHNAYGLHYLLTPRMTIYSTGTTDHGGQEYHTPTETQLYSVSCALYINPLIFNLGIRWRRVVTSCSGHFTPGKMHTFIEHEDGLAPEQVWAFCRRDKTLVHTGIRIPDRPGRSLIDVQQNVRKTDSQLHNGAGR